MRKNKHFVNKYLGIINIKNIDKFIEEHEVVTGIFKGLHVGNTFDILYEGKKKTIIIAGFDYKYKPGDKHNIVCIPVESFCKDCMNPIPDGLSYEACDMNTCTLPVVNEILKETFGNYLLSSKELLEGEDGIGKYTCESVLMSEIEIFGRTICGGYDHSKQLPLFKILGAVHFTPRLIWLRNECMDKSLYGFCYINNCGDVEPVVAGIYGGVMPRFLIG